MRKSKISWLFFLAATLVSLTVAGVAHAQDVHIVYPKEGQDVRGEITAHFEGIPSGGYALVTVDGQFRQATAQDSIVFDTISDRATFARGDSAYRLEITVLNAGGKRVGTDAVTFNVANQKVETAGASVRLVHWTPGDRLGNVQRYRVFAESNATMSGAATGGGAAASAAPGAGGGGVGGGAASGDSIIAAPLDWQLSALMRRVVRDTGLLNGSANISTIVQEAFERQRLGSGGGGATGTDTAAPGAQVITSRKQVSTSSGPHKDAWNQDANGTPIWTPAAETGKYFIKMIQQDGTEVNATRKAPSIAIADLLPTFPDVPVRPGSTWFTTMSFVSDLSTRQPINVKDASITFTAYENLQTPGGENRRCAKLESRFLLPSEVAKEIAANLANKSGGATGGGGVAAAGGADAPAGGAGAPTAGAATGGLTASDITVARTNFARVIWFDVERRRILRAEDSIRTYFELPQTAATAAAPQAGDFGPPGGAGAVAAAPTPPQTVDYDMKVTTWLDDRIPNPTGEYQPGGAGAHLRDSVTEPGLSRILTSNVSIPTP